MVINQSKIIIMSQNFHGAITRLSRSKSSCIGPAYTSRCRENQLAECKCDIHQPLAQPHFEETHNFLSRFKTPGLTEGNLKETCTLLPANTRTLILWKDEEDGEYCLTAVKEESEEVFLNLPLCGVVSGKLIYDTSQPLWHQVTICGQGNQQPRHLVFNLQTSEAGAAAHFNKEIEAAFQALKSSKKKEAHCELDVFLEGNVAAVVDQKGDATQRQTSGVLMSAAPVPHPGMAAPKPQAPLVGAEAPPAPAPVMGVAELASSTAAVTAAPSTRLPAQQGEDLCVRLVWAIQAGEAEKARELAAVLAHSRAHLHIHYDASLQESKAKEQLISITVHVEDRESTGLTLSDIKVPSSDTIKDLKRSFYHQYGFPPEVQKWIIGKRICSDEDSLSKCEVHCSGHTLYLYLLTARSLNLQPHQYSAQGARTQAAGTLNTSDSSMRARTGSDYETMQYPMSPATPVLGAGSQEWTGPQALKPSGQQSQLSATSSAASLLTGPPFPEVSPSLDPVSGGGPQQQALTLEAASQRARHRSGAAAAGLPPESMEVETGEPVAQGWQCESCTLINQPTRPGCEACGGQRPPTYQLPAHYVLSQEERQRFQREQQMEALMQQREVESRESNYQQLVVADSSEVVSNTLPFTCPICLEHIAPPHGIVLRDCLHQFCKTCLTEAVRLTEEAELKCPFQDELYACNAHLQEREVRALVPDAVYERFLRRSLAVAESQAEHSYHCQTPDCPGWCFYQDLLNFFLCPVCRQENCLTCRAIHTHMDCRQYQEDLKLRAANDQAAQQTQLMLQDMLEKGKAMHCPKCQVIVQKKNGCDWIRCSICKTEICWVTKGFRWGPKGEGDTSAGCKCRVGGKRCHPKCNNCH